MSWDLKTISFIYLILLPLFLLPTNSYSANSQTIPEKKFSSVNSPVFLTNGFINFSAASRNQSTAFEQQTLPDGFTTNGLHNLQSIGNDSQFFFKTGIMTQDRAKYGAVAKAEFNFNSDGRNENPNLDQAFLFSEQSFGKFEFGNYQAVNQKMKTGPAQFARGAGGINGKYLEQVNMPMLASGSLVCDGAATDDSCANIKLPRFILLAQSPIGHGGYAKSFYTNGASNGYEVAGSNYGNSTHSHFRALKDDSFDGMEDSTKLSYYSPRMKGLQFGLSYTPDASNNGITANTAKDVDSLRIKNVFSFGANYSEYFDNLGLALSATAEKGQIKNSESTLGVNRADLFSYDLAATVSYFGFSFGASYGSWGDSLQANSGIYSCDYDSSLSLSDQTCSSNRQKFRNPYYYSAGIGYEFGPFATSVTGLYSEFQKNTYQAVSFGVDYKLSKDLMPYFEITKFTFESNQPEASDIANQSSLSSSQRQLKDNRGYVFLTGILFSF